MTTLERMCRAMLDIKNGTPTPDLDWRLIWSARYVDGGWEIFKQAQAAIEVMKKPGSRIWEEARIAQYAYDKHETLPYDYAWPVMIDAILANK